MLRYKKVCILTSVHPAFDTRIFHKEAKTLVRAGYKVSLIAQHRRNETVDGIKVIALPKPRNRFYRFLGIFEIFKIALQEEANIYHFHDPELMPVGIFLKLSGKRVIYDVHEDVPKSILSRSWLPKIVRKPVSILVDCFEKLFSKKFDYVIAATPSIRSNFRQDNIIDIRNYPIIKLHLHLLPPPTASFREAKWWGRIKEGRGGDSYTLIYAGGLDKVRGIKEIVQSLKFVKYNVKLKLLGRFSEKEFKSELNNLEKWSKVEFLGWVPPEELTEHLRKADIGLVCFWPAPNHIEALPNKLFEYMAMGLPVIASDFPLWKEIIEGNNCGLTVNPLNPGEIAKVIEHLIEHPEEAKKMGENGRKAVLEKYNWEKEGKKLLKVYEKFIIFTRNNCNRSFHYYSLPE